MLYLTNKLIFILHKNTDIIFRSKSIDWYDIENDDRFIGLGITLTLSLIRQFCSRRHWTYFVKKPMTKRGKHCGKSSNCLFWAISSFVTMFSKSLLLQRRQKVSIWGKGLTLNQWTWLTYPTYRLFLFCSSQTLCWGYS